MAECSECGEEDMTFTCRYCGERFCSEHRLPENHDCPDLDSSGEDQRWFQEKKEVRDELKVGKPRKPSLARDIAKALASNLTLLIIALTTLSFLLQGLIDGYTELLLFEPTVSAVLEQPWSILTVMLVHGGQFHLFANMVTLYFFGTAVERALDRREFISLYLGAGVVSTGAYFLFRNLLFQIHGAEIGAVPTLSPAVGASGAVVAVFATAAMLYPMAEVLLYFVIPMRIGSAMKLFAAVEVANLSFKLAGTTLPVIGGFASSAHLAGLAAGLWFGRKVRDRHRGKLRLDFVQG